MKRICLLTENRYRGGLDTFVKNLVGNWPNTDDEFLFLANKSHPGIGDVLEALHTDVSLFPLFTPYSKILDGIHSGSNKTTNIVFKKLLRLIYMIFYFPIFVPICIICLSITFRRIEFDDLLIVNGGHPGSLACRVAPISWFLSGKRGKCIYNVHNSPVKFGPFRSIPEWLLNQSVVFFCSAIVTVSRSCFEDFKCCPNIYSSKKFSVIHNGISDPLKISEDVDDQSPNISPKYCLMMSTFEERKGHKFLLDSFVSVAKEIPELTLKIYGSGTEKEKETIENYIAELGLTSNVELNGFAESPFELLRDSYLLLAPSQEHESFGLTLIEAMAMKVPFIATSIGGMVEVGQQSNGGYFCEKSDKDCLAEQIISLVKNPELRREKGQNGRRFFEKRFQASDMAHKYYLLINAK